MLMTTPHCSKHQPSSLPPSIYCFPATSFLIPDLDNFYQWGERILVKLCYLSVSSSKSLLAFVISWRDYGVHL